MDRTMPLHDPAHVRRSMVQFMWAVEKLPSEVAGDAFARIVEAASKFGIDVYIWSTAVFGKLRSRS